MALQQHLRSIARYNLTTWKKNRLAEVSGALGDLGTLLPLMIAMTINDSIDLASTLVFSGLANILTGVFYGIPLPVQPMKAIAAVAISRGLSRDETTAAGLTIGLLVLFLSITGLLKWLHAIIPVPIVRGIQVSAGLSLVIGAGTNLLVPLHWSWPLYDNKIILIIAFLLLILTHLLPRFPYALVSTIVGVLIALAIPTTTNSHHIFPFQLWHPTFVIPGRSAWVTGAIDAAIPQLPLTTLNSIIAVTSLSGVLFPEFPPTPSTTSLGLSVATANLIGCWFGAMPVCHGSGGLAGQYHFGARSGMSIILLGGVKLVLGLFVGDALLPTLQRFPKSLLGMMVVAAGVELAKIGRDVGNTRTSGGEDDESEARERWTVMLITVAGCLAFKNDAVGFLAGMTWHWGTRLFANVAERLGERRRIRLAEHDERSLVGDGGGALA